MAGNIKKLYFASGADVTPPTDLTLETSNYQINSYADVAAFEAGIGRSAVNEDVFLNTTDKKLWMNIGGDWFQAVRGNDSTDETKTFTFDLTGCTTGTAQTFDLNSTSSRTYTFPDYNGIFVLNTNTAADPTILSDATGTVTIGGSGSTVVVQNLRVEATTTQVDTTNLNIKDKNILINDGGDDASSEGAGLTVERTGTSGSMIYANAAATKWKIGAIGAEVEAVDISTAQTLTNKTISGASNTISDVDLASQVTGTLPIGNGGTGQTTANNALNALLPSQTGNAGKFLQTDASNASWVSSSTSAPYSGQSSGTAVASGNIGEMIEYTTTSDFSQGSPTQNTWYDVTSASISITAGVWRVYASGTAGLNWSNSSGTPFPTPHMGIRDGSNTLLASAIATTPSGSSSASTSYFGTTFAECYQAVGSTTTIKLSVKWSQATGGTASVSNVDLRADPTYYSSIVLRAVRIA